MRSVFPRDVLDEIGDLIESVSEVFPTYFCISFPFKCKLMPSLVCCVVGYCFWLDWKLGAWLESSKFNSN